MTNSPPTTQIPNPAEGRRLLRKFIADHDLSLSAVARGIGRSAPALFGILHRRNIPAADTRRAIEVFTGIPAWIWGLTPAEKASAAALSRVTPFAARPTAA